MNENIYDLAVIGAGLSGTAAACFAVAKGFTVALIGKTRGELPFASGLLDLLGTWPPSAGELLRDPLAMAEHFTAKTQDHPYSLMGLGEAAVALDELTAQLKTVGLRYRGAESGNCRVVTAAGNIRPSFRVPETVWPGCVAVEKRSTVLFVDFEGMKDFSAGLAAGMATAYLPGSRAVTLTFPQGFPGRDRHNILLAEAIESPAVCAELARALRPLANGCGAVAFPAVLGLQDPAVVAGNLSKLIGLPVFEIPTLPPSVPGQRLQSGLDRFLSHAGARLLHGRSARSVQSSGGLCTGVVVGEADEREIVHARSVLVATGRFIGGGLFPRPSGIEEPLLSIPVEQPVSREQWYREEFFDLRGHPLNRAGIRVDERFRPLGRDGLPLFQNLYAAGTILAGHDWVREKSGAGIAISTARAVVESID